MDANHTVLQMLEARRNLLKQEQASNALAIEEQIKKILIENFGPKYIKSNFDKKNNSIIIVLGTTVFRVYRIYDQWTAELETHEVHSATDPDCSTAVDKLLTSIRIYYPDLTRALDLLLADSINSIPLVTSSMLEDCK